MSVSNLKFELGHVLFIDIIGYSKLLPVSKDAFDGPFYIEELAEIQARVGNTDKAISLLRQLLQIPAGIVLSPALLRLDPAWDSLRNDPGFQKLSEGE